MPLKYHPEDKKMVFDATVKLLKEKQQQKPVRQRITNGKIEGYAEFQSRKQNNMIIQPLKSYGLDPQTFKQLAAEFDSLSDQFALEIINSKMNMMELPSFNAHDDEDAFSDVTTSESEPSVCESSPFTKRVYPKRVLDKMEKMRQAGKTEDEISEKGSYLYVDYHNVKKEKKKFLAANPGQKFNAKSVVTPVFEMKLPDPLLQKIKNTSAYRSLTGP